MHRAAYQLVGDIAARPQGLRPTAYRSSRTCVPCMCPWQRARRVLNYIHIYMYICMLLARSGRDCAVRSPSHSGDLSDTPNHSVAWRANDVPRPSIVRSPIVRLSYNRACWEFFFFLRPPSSLITLDAREECNNKERPRGAQRPVHRSRLTGSPRRCAPLLTVRRNTSLWR